MNKIEHLLRHRDVDLDKLKRRIEQRLGRPVGMAARRPTDDEAGVILFEEADTGARIALDPRMVVTVIEEVAGESADTADQPPTNPGVARDLLTEFEDARSDTQRWAVVGRFLTLAADAEEHQHQHAVGEWRQAREAGRRRP